MAQWKFKGTDSFAGGIQSVFLKPIVEKLIHLNKGTLKNPSINSPRIDFNGTTGKGSLGIGSYINVVGDMLINLGELNAQFKNSKYNTPNGIYIAEVIPGSSLAQAGIVPGDIITKLDRNKLPLGEENVTTLLDVYIKRKDIIKIEYIHFVDQFTMNIQEKIVPIGNFSPDLEYVFADTDYELVSAPSTLVIDNTNVSVVFEGNVTEGTYDSPEFTVAGTTLYYDFFVAGQDTGGSDVKFYFIDVTANTVTFLNQVNQGNNNLNVTVRGSTSVVVSNPYKFRYVVAYFGQPNVSINASTQQSELP